MSDYIPSFNVRLGLGLNADERSIKRAYARILKTLDPELQAEEFEQLRSDYEQALEHVRNPGREYYFDAEELIFNTHVEESSQTDSINSSNKSVIATHDITFSGLIDVADRIDNQNTSTPYQDAAFAFQDFCQKISDTKISTLANSELADLFRNFLQRDDLIAFEARLHFENFLIHALAQRHFGQVSGRLLIACAAFFNWDTADSKRLADNDSAGHELRVLLDNFLGLTDMAKLNLLTMSDPPYPEFAYFAVSKFEEYKIFSKQLFLYFVDDKQEKSWHQAKKNAPFLSLLEHAYTVCRNRFAKIEESSSRLFFFVILIIAQFLYHYSKK